MNNIHYAKKKILELMHWLQVEILSGHLKQF